MNIQKPLPEDISLILGSDFSLWKTTTKALNMPLVCLLCGISWEKVDSPFGLKKLHEISKDIEIEMEQKIFQISREDLAYAYMLVKEFLKAVDLFDTPPENFGEKILLAESYFEIDALEIAKPLLEELISVYNKYTAQAYVILGRIQKKENKSPQIVSSTIMLAIRKAQQEADLQAEAMLWLAYSEILGEFGLSKEARRAFLEAYKLQKELLQRNQEN